MFAHKTGYALTAYLFLTLDNDPYIDRHGAAAGLKQRFESLYVAEHLPLVVHRPARVEVAVPLRGLKRRRQPLVQRVWRLDVVMAIGQAGRLTGGMQPVSVDQGVTGGFDDPDVLEANAV